MLESFLIEYTAGRGLGIACNTFRMLVKHTLQFCFQNLEEQSYACTKIQIQHT
jgi:hypothetical protein